MRKGNGFLWVLLSVFALAIMSGGCGGGGGGDAVSEPDLVSFEALSGTWALRDGEGKVVDGSDEYQLELDAGQAAFEMVTSGDEESVFDVSLEMYLDVYEGSSRVDSFSFKTTEEEERESVAVKRAARNQFRYAADYGTIDITVLSDTSARVDMSLTVSDGGSITMEFYMDKQAEGDPIDVSIYSGTWKPVPGRDEATLTGLGGPYDLRLASGKAEIEFVSAGASVARININSEFRWDIYKDNSSLDELIITRQDDVEAVRVGENGFKYEFEDGGVVNITINSANSITVSETGTVEISGESNLEENTYQYSASYKLTKVIN
jgi:hypothetical protein